MREVGVEEEKLLAGLLLFQVNPNRSPPLRIAHIPAAGGLVGGRAEEEIAVVDLREAVLTIDQAGVSARSGPCSGNLQIAVVRQVVFQIGPLFRARLLQADHIGLNRVDHLHDGRLAYLPIRVALIVGAVVADIERHYFQRVRFAFVGSGSVILTRRARQGAHCNSTKQILQCFHSFFL